MSLMEKQLNRHVCLKYKAVIFSSETITFMLPSWLIEISNNKWGEVDEDILAYIDKVLCITNVQNELKLNL